MYARTLLHRMIPPQHAGLLQQAFDDRHQIKKLVRAWEG